MIQIVRTLALYINGDTKCTPSYGVLVAEGKGLINIFTIVKIIFVVQSPNIPFS